MSKGKKNKKSSRKSASKASAAEQTSSGAERSTRYVGMFRGSSVAALFGGATACIVIFCLLQGLSVQESLIGGLIGGVCLTPAVIIVDRVYGSMKKKYQR
jgi:hypothetical protein